VRLSVKLRARPSPGAWTRVVIVIIFVVTLRWAPGAALPLGLGGWLATAEAGRPAAIRRAR